MDRPDAPMDKTRRAGQFDRDDRPTEQSLAPFARLLAAIGIALALVVGTFNLAQSLLGPIQGYDFAQFYVAAGLVVDGDTELLYVDGGQWDEAVERYGVPAFVEDGEAQSNISNVYPPSAIVVFVPFNLLPWDAARLAFYFISLVAASAALWLLAGDRENDEGRWLRGTALFGAAVFFPLWYSQYLGQVNAVLLLLIVGSLVLLRRDHPVAAGALIGVAAAVKLYPAAFIVFFVLKRQWSAAISAVCSGLAVVLITLPIVGVDPWRAFVEDVLPEEASAGANYRNQGIHGAFTRLFTDNETVRPLLDAPSLATALSLLASLGLLAAVLWFSRKRSTPGSHRYELEYFVFLVAVVMALQKSFEHYALLFLPAYAILVTTLVRSASAPRWRLVVTLSSFFVWARLLETGADYDALPTSLVANPLYNLKFFASVALVVVGLAQLARPTAASETDGSSGALADDGAHTS